MTSDITIRSDLRPGDLGRVIALHGTAYEGENNHFGLVFEAFVAKTVSDYILESKGRGRIFLAERGAELVACAAIVERPGPNGVGGQLRWVLVDPSVRGLGLGEKLVTSALDHAREAGWREIFLETTDGLDASMRLYRKLGFEIVSSERQSLWIDDVNVITMRLKLG